MTCTVNSSSPTVLKIGLRRRRQKKCRNQRVAGSYCFLRDTARKFPLVYDVDGWVDRRMKNKNAFPSRIIDTSCGLATRKSRCTVGFSKRAVLEISTGALKFFFFFIARDTRIRSLVRAIGFCDNAIVGDDHTGKNKYFISYIQQSVGTRYFPVQMAPLQI